MEPFDLRLWDGFAAAGGDCSAPAITDQIAIDSRRINSPSALFVPLPGKIYDGHHFIAAAATAGAKYVLADKKWSPEAPLKDNVTILRVDSPLKAFQQIAHAYRQQFSCLVVAIAGSYGKTMVKDLLQAMLAPSYCVVASPESFNSQIGVALSLLTIKKQHEIALIEAGISEANEMDSLAAMINPDCAVITHIGKKHSTTLGNLDEIASEIIKIIALSKKRQWAIMPKDPHLLPHLQGSDYQHYFWNELDSSLPQAFFTSKERGAKIPYCIDFPAGEKYFGVMTSGFYYFLDLINITVKTAWKLGVSNKAIESVLRDYIPEPMRTEIWKSSVGTLFINDTYSSDPQSVDQALNLLQKKDDNGRKIFAFGGLKQAHQHLETDYKRIGNAIHKAKIDLLMLYGKHNFHPLVEELSSLSPEVEIIRSDTYKDALQILNAKVKNDDTVLIKGDRKQSIDLITETFNDSICNNQCIINLTAITHNIKAIRKKVGDVKRLMVMVKALAYGTDEVRMAKFLETQHVDILGVSYIDEGIVLKRAGVSQAIFVINAACYEAAKIVKWDLEVGVSDKSLINAIATAAEKQNKRIKVHLHVDTGMCRFGCRPEEALELATLISKTPSLQLEGIMTHLSCAEDPSQDSHTLSQIEVFNQTVQLLKSHGISPPWIHAANSAGAIRFKFPECNMARIGLAIYGLHGSQSTKEGIDLHLALTLLSRIVGINVCRQGESISYGRNYRVTKKKQHIAVLPIGYFDGLHRNYSGKGHVIIRGQKAAMVGNICMDFMMVDVTDIPHVVPGDPVLIFGEDEYGHYLSPEEVAHRGDSIIHELITCLGPRIQRIFVYEEAHRNY